jgi:ATP-dependent RNA helicase SUPV3L1/SUV3
MVPSESTTGIVTSLRAGDLPVIREALAESIDPINKAALGIPFSRVAQVAALNPFISDYADLIRIIVTLARTAPDYYITSGQVLEQSGTLLKPIKNLTLAEKERFCFAPVAARIPQVSETFVKFANAQAFGHEIDVTAWAKNIGLTSRLESVEAARADPHQHRDATFFTHSLLLDLEAWHRSLVLYLWLAHRYPLTFPSKQEASALKNRTEEALQYSLQQMGLDRSKGKKKGTRQYLQTLDVPESEPVAVV